MKISLCITVFNEEKHIEKLLESIVHQTKSPDEVVIVDGGSTDDTADRIKNYESRIKGLRLVVKKGNRPFGRNESIKHATSDIIAITDSGCELDKNWLEEITRPFTDPKTEVVSGYYKGKPKNGMEEALVPFVLVMPERIDAAHFLPSTRSMAMKKSVWEKMGGFPQEYRWNEDYVFSKRIEKAGIPILFAQKALVYWFPRESLGEGWKMFYAFAKGDAQAGIWRPKVVFLMIRCLLVLLILGYILFTHSVTGWIFFLTLTICYFLWAIFKNVHYVKRTSAVIFLAFWQILSDTAVFLGTFVGFFDTVRKNSNI